MLHDLVHELRDSSASHVQQQHPQPQAADEKVEKLSCCSEYGIYVAAALILMMIPPGIIYIMTHRQDAKSTSDEKVPKVPGEFSVMSFNILAPIWVGDDGKTTGPFFNYVPSTSYFKTENRRPLIVKTILGSNPDILLLQEAQESEIEFLKGELTGYTLVTNGYHGKDTKGVEMWRQWIKEEYIHKWQPNGNPIFVRTSLVDTLDAKSQARTIKVSSDGCSVGAIVITVNNKRVAIVNVHMSHPTDAQLIPNVPNNEYQWEQIQKFCKAQKVDHTVIGGDYNVNVDHDFYKKLIAEKWVDHGKAFKEFWGTCTSLAYNKTERHTERIDYIMSDGMKCSAFKAPVRVPISKRNQIQQALEACGSDHLPLYAEFQILTRPKSGNRNKNRG